MKIGKNKVVELEYELIVDGVTADKTTEERGPLDYIHGNNMLLPKFEEAIEGMEPGEEFRFTLAPADGYGEYDPEKIFELDKQAFSIDGKVREDLLEPGNVIPMINQNGGIERGIVVAVNGNTVTMDFNIPLAGKTLNFSGKVVSVRDATEKELTEGLHGEFLPKGHCCHSGKGHGCCHDGNHSGECCHGKEHEDENCCHQHGEGQGKACCNGGESAGDGGCNCGDDTCGCGECGNGSCGCGCQEEGGECSCGNDGCGCGDDTCCCR